jgi:hypothetical protein
VRDPVALAAAVEEVGADQVRQAAMRLLSRERRLRVRVESSKRALRGGEIDSVEGDLFRAASPGEMFPTPGAGR